MSATATTNTNTTTTTGTTSSTTSTPPESTSTQSLAKELFALDEARKHFMELRETSKYYDVVLNHGSNSYKVHRIILSHKSEFFRDLFDKGEKNVTLEYDDQDNVFPLVLDFLYEGGGDFSKRNITSSNVIAIKLAANYFKINELSKSVEQFLSSNINKDSAFTLLKKALQYKDDVLMKSSVEFIAKNFSNLMEDFHKIMPTLPPQVFIDIVSDPNFSVGLKNPEAAKKYSVLLFEFLELHQIMKNIELTEKVLDALKKSETLTAELALMFIKYYNNASSQGVELSDEKKTQALKSCFPIIASNFHKLEKQMNSPVSSSEQFKDFDLAELPVALFCEVMSSDELVTNTEDDVYTACLKYLEKHESKLSESEKHNVLKCVRFSFLSYDKLQAILSELKSGSKPVLKSVNDDIMDALYARLSRNESSKDPISSDNPSLKPRIKRIFVHQTDFDTNGILYWIGCLYGTTKYENPVSRNLVKVTSSQSCEAGKTQDLISHTPMSCNLLGGANTTVTIELVGVEVLPTKYSLRHTDGRDAECLRNWKFYGSKDGVTWKELRNHANDATLNKKSATGTWELQSKEYFPFFRLEQTGNNSSNSQYLSLAGVELYGLVEMRDKKK